MSEPRKSRREAKLTQRFKEFIGEESSSVKGQTPAKAAKTPAKSTAKPKDSPKSAAKVPPPTKATPIKKGVPKAVAAAKESPLPAVVKPSTPAPKAPVKASPVASLKVSTSTVTQNVRKTSIKEVKKVAAAVKAKNEKEPEVLRSKRVPKPSAKIAEAKETEAALAEPVKKPLVKLTTATRVTTPTPPKVIKGIVSKVAAPSAVGRGASPAGRGRGLPLRGRGRGWGRGRGRGRGTPQHLAEEMLSEEDDEEDVDDDEDDDENDDDEDMEEENINFGKKLKDNKEGKLEVSMDVDGIENDTKESFDTMDDEMMDDDEEDALDEEDGLDEEEDEDMNEEHEVPTKSPKKVATTVGAPSKKIQIISKSSNDVISSPTKPALSLKKAPASPSRQASPDTKTVMVSSKTPLTGTSLNPIVKKVMVNSGNPVSIATQLQRKNNIADGTAVPPSDAVVRNSVPNKQQSPIKLGGGVKRIITTTATSDSPLTKKMKLAAGDKSGVVSASSSAADTATTASPVKTVSASVLKMTSPVKVTSSAAGRPIVVNRLAVVGRPASAATPTNGVTPAMLAKSGPGRPSKLIKAGPASVKAAANKAALAKAAGGAASSGSDNESTRRSRRQPKPTARMKEFLHRSSEEDEELGAEEAGLDASLLEDEEDEDEDMDFDSDDEEVSSKVNRRFLDMMEEASSTPKGLQKKPISGNTRTMPLLSGPKSHVIKTQVVRKVGPTPVIADKKVVAAQTSAKTMTKLIQVKQDQLKQGLKGVLQRPDGINGDARKMGQAMGKPGLKITTAGGPRKETPIIIRVRTMDAEQLAQIKKRQQEADSKYADKKTIVVDTQANKARKMRLDNLVVRRDSMKDDSESMHSEEESDIDDPLEEEEEPEEEEDQEEEEEDEDEEEAAARPPLQKRPNVALNKKPLPEKCTRLLSLCKEAVNTLKQRQKAFKESDAVDKTIERRSLNKFLSLSEQIVDIIKQSIEEDPDSISDSDNFEEYCQDMLDSIAFKGDEDDLTTAEAERLEQWLRLKEAASGTAVAEDQNRSEQLKLYQQMLYLLTSVEHGARGEDFDDEEMEGGEDEDEEDEDEEPEFTQGDSYGPYGPSEDEDDLGVEEEEEEEEEDDEETEGSSAAALDRR